MMLKSRLPFARKNALPFIAACLTVLLLMVGPAASAQSDAQEPVQLTIRITTQNKVTVRLYEPEGKALVRGHVDALRQTFHGELSKMYPTVRTAETNKDGIPIFDEMAAEWNPPVLFKGLHQDAEIDLAPLRKALQQTGNKFLHVDVTLPKYGTSYCDGATRTVRFRTETYHQYIPTSGKTGSVLRFGYGFTVQDAQRTAATLIVVLLLPVLITLWLRHRALSAKNADPTALWFSFSQATSWVETAFWFVWAGFVISSKASDMMSFALNIPRIGIASPTWIFLLLIPRGLVTVINATLAQPVYARIRGIEMSSGSLARRSAWTQALNYLPLNFSMYGIFSLGVDNRQVVLWFAASFVTRYVCANRLAELSDAKPFAVTTGPLRDYIFGMAAHVGVKLRNIILLPAAQMQEANAFASANGSVLLTDYLLQKMTRREVNAVMGHEITHLQHKHANTMGFVRGALTYIPLFMLIIVRVFVANPIADWFIWYPVAALCGLPLATYISRRYEQVADLGACQLTGDPEAMISSLSRLSRLSMHPQEWGRVTSRLITHPSTRRRALYISEAWKMPSSRMEELLATPLEGERYEVPSVAMDKELVFSTTWQVQKNTRRMIYYLIAMLMPLLLVGWAVQREWFDSAMQWPAYSLGLVASCAFYVYVTRATALLGMTEIKARLRQKLSPQLRPELETMAAAFAPGGLPRTYQAFRFWDMGFLQIGPDALCYVGERTMFTLRREDIVEIQVVEGKSNWWTVPRVAIAWRNAEEYASGVFSLGSQEGKSITQLQRENTALLARLETWRKQPQPEESAERITSLGLPFNENVTGTDPKTLGSLATLSNILKLTVIIAYAAAALTGLSFRTLGETPPSGWYVVIGMALVSVFSWIPQYRYKEPRVPAVPPVPPRPPAPVPAPVSSAPVVPPMPGQIGRFDLR